MRTFPYRRVTLATVALCVMLLLACSASKDTSPTPAPTPVSTPTITIHTPPRSGSMSVEEAIEAARAAGPPIAQDSPIQEIDVSFRPMHPSGIWTIKFKGLFSFPFGPLELPDATVQPRGELDNREVEVWVDDGTRQFTGLTVRAAESCS